MERLIAKREIEAAADVLIGIGCTWDEAKNLLYRAVLDKALEGAGGNKCKAARSLKMHRNTFERAIKRTA